MQIFCAYMHTAVMLFQSKKLRNITGYFIVKILRLTVVNYLKFKFINKNLFLYSYNLVQNSGVVV